MARLPLRRRGRGYGIAAKDGAGGVLKERCHSHAGEKDECRVLCHGESEYEDRQGAEAIDGQQRPVVEPAGFRAET